MRKRDLVPIGLILTLVARNIEDRKFYEPDCMVFVTGQTSAPTSAAFGPLQTPAPPPSRRS